MKKTRCPHCETDNRKGAECCHYCGHDIPPQNGASREETLRSSDVAGHAWLVVCSAPAGDVIACRYCKLRLTLDQVKAWVGCDACNDGEDWLKAAIQHASSPNAALSDGANVDKP